MKNKKVAARLALFGGQLGLHRFYLGQRPLAYFYFFPFLGALIGVLDAVILSSMDEATFNRRYNLDQYNPGKGVDRRGAPVRTTSRSRIHEQRQRERSQREERRRANQTARRRPASDKSGRRRNPVGKAPAKVGKNRPEPGHAERQAGLRYFREFEYDRAIIAFERAIEANPGDVASHFNLACSHSCEENANEAFFHLDRAVALGFTDFERIQTHDSLAFLRVQPRYADFEANGYRLTDDRAEQEVVLEEPVKEESLVELPEINDDLLEQLQRLATLREKGLLTENEFTAQKQRLLG